MHTLKLIETMEWTLFILRQTKITIFPFDTLQDALVILFIYSSYSTIYLSYSTITMEVMNVARTPIQSIR